MIKTENLIINEKEFIRTFSDSGYMIERESMRYSEAVDPVEFNRQYIETDESIEIEPMTETEQKAHAYDIIMGVTE